MRFADPRCRLVEAVNLETDEALLTGESLPVFKDAKAIFDDTTGPGDRLNVVFSSSTVTKGRGRGIVFATGMYTEIGSIATALRGSGRRHRPVKRREDGSIALYRYAQAGILTVGDFIGDFLGVNVGTPLQRRLSQLAVLLFGIAVVFAIIVLAANRFINDKEVIIYAVATGLAMIPASLVVVLTITMAAGTKRMVKRNVVVRKLNSLESLGGVTSTCPTHLDAYRLLICVIDICSDKTGTLTQGKMVVRKAWIPSKGTYSVEPSSNPIDPTNRRISHIKESPCENDETMGEVFSHPKDLVHNNSSLEEYLNIASLANLADVHQSGEGSWTARGDPTEIALQVFASRFDWNRRRLTEDDDPEWIHVAELPFDSDVKKMSTIFQRRGSKVHFVFTKGAVERVLASCTQVFWDQSGHAIDIADAHRDAILRNMEALAAQGLRVLALASRKMQPMRRSIPNQDIDRSSVETELTFQGLIGLYDPPRPESAPAVERCHLAGISVHMLTGDHRETAKAIAKQVGILPTNNRMIAADVADSMVMTATEFDALSDKEIDDLPVLPLVIARCAPKTKVRMIEALHRRKCAVAMTGDGVNDSPSLKRADVGIAMGQSGSDVAKDASDIVLADDNFVSILNAVEEGRRMFDNIQKFVLHLLSQNIAQALTLLIGLAFKDRTGLSVFPLSPVEIMWVIMVTSSAPDMGLGLEAAAPDIMDRPPSRFSSIFTAELVADIMAYGLWMAALCLAAFTLVLMGFSDGQIGDGCNASYSAGCDAIFSARATTFVGMTWFSLFLAWELVNTRRSFFRMQPGSTHYLTQWARDVWRNQFLFWSVIAGFITIFPTLYILVINNDVFKHEGINWEWAVVFVEAVLFFAGVEAWKFAKRVFYRRKAHKPERKGSADLELVFSQYLTRTTSEEAEKSETKV